MVHFYDEISALEMFTILQNNLSDIETFARAVVDLLKNPGKFNLTLEE